LTSYSDFNYSDSSEEPTFAASDVPLIEVRNVVQAINFVHSIETPLFNHGKGTSWTLFSWLEEQSNSFV
jgi:hypothetical protein